MEQAQGGRQTNAPKPPRPNQKSEGGSRGGGKPPGRGRGGRDGGGSSKARGLEKDSPEVRTSKTLSWILRHGAASEGLEMRSDGYVKVNDLVCISFSLCSAYFIDGFRFCYKFKNSRIQALGLTLEQLKTIVSNDMKQRYSLVFETTEGNILAYTAVEGEGGGKGEWLIKANQGHSLKVCLRPYSHTYN